MEQKFSLEFAFLFTIISVFFFGIPIIPLYLWFVFDHPEYMGEIIDDVGRIISFFQWIFSAINAFFSFIYTFISTIIDVIVTILTPLFNLFEIIFSLVWTIVSIIYKIFEPVINLVLFIITLLLPVIERMFVDQNGPTRGGLDDIMDWTYLLLYIDCLFNPEDYDDSMSLQDLRDEAFDKRDVDGDGR